jgi:hypothetical protein
MSPELLLKQDFLTEEEFAIMRKHADYAHFRGAHHGEKSTAQRE